MKSNLLLPASMAAFAIFLLGAATVSAQSILLSAEDFVLLGGTSVSVAGAGPNTYSNGDVGSMGSISGFPPATVVNGSTILGGAVVAQAMLDLGTARTGLSALATTSNLTGQDLSGMTLAPGVYAFNVSAEISLAGTRILTLDAQGQNNVVWVFNIGTSLTTAAGAQIRFVNLGSNGGADNGLFWNAGTTITFGADNTVLGNYLAGTDIIFGTTTPSTGSGGGRALAQAGVSFDGAASLDALGGPGGGTLTGGLTLNGGIVTANGYVLLSSDGAYIPGTSGLVLIPGTNYNTTNVTVDGDSSDALATPATFTVFQTIAKLTGTNTYTGGTIIDAGQLTTGSENLPVNGNVSFIDSANTGAAGELIFDQATNGTYGGVISGGGDVTKEGLGDLTFTALQTYTGTTTVNEGKLIASLALLPANGDITLGAAGTLVLDEASNVILNNALSGTGTLEKQGAGALVIANATTVAVDIQNGSLFLVNNVGSTTVGTGTFLRGEGTINGNLLNNGTVSAGSSPGTIIVAGNFMQGPAGTLVVEFASSTSFDRLIVSGTADLDGTLELVTLNGFNPVGESFTIITATGGVNGTFPTVIAPATPAAITRTVNYGTNDVTVTYTQIPFSTFAETPNQGAVGDGALNNPAITDVLNTLALPGQFPAALNALSPQGYQVWSDIAFAHTASLASRLAHQPPATPGRDNFYFEAGQSRGRTSGDANVGSNRFNSDSGLVGGNTFVTPDLTLGGFFEYTDTDSGLGSFGSTTNIKTKMPGIRAAWKKDAWFVTAAAAYGFDDYESTRQINFSGTSATARSDTTGRQWLVDIIAGRHFLTGPVSLSPFAGLQVAGWKTEGFTETGAGAFNNTVGDQSARSLRTQLGLEAAIAFNAGNVVIRPHARGAWVHELSNDSRSIDASFGGSNYSVQTHSPQRDSARLSAGFDVAFTPRVALYADYSIQTGNTVEILGEWRGGLSVSF
ncbi:autotransporter domain-containing protein [Rariglobus hedericola]|uniref:Autotransporter domain-containing protein n=1 Tax=Rariglobus hedericola TaxID=2597822 RepID=A0A556QSB0_9BACT|nr:autotransporter domain-containing protein [Rariglobus hedericola]TSJ79521.1 autotransporter domain-containing protein [Rariglobus hedericola]